MLPPVIDAMKALWHETMFKSPYVFFNKNKKTFALRFHKLSYLETSLQKGRVESTISVSDKAYFCHVDD